MSYLVLARKSRPQIFTEVVGQKSVVKTLQNSIARQRIAHAILFSGVQGVGKTTLARIMAKAINCQAPPAQRPCNKCQSCLDISAGRALDLIEIDGASNRGIHEIRELKENIKFMPAHSAHKVIIIDEVHMLTTEAFNALLKTLEEPPAHVYFMFATTEIHKIPVTILSRCQQYELKKISAKELLAHFQKLADSEDVTIDAAALALIVREAAGSIRDGLSLLDQMFSYGGDKVTLDDVVEVLGLVSRKTILQLSRALLEGNKKQVFSSLEQVFAQGVHIKRFVEDLLDTFRNLLLSSIRGSEELIDVPDEELAFLQKLATGYSTETIHLKLALLMEAAEALQYTPEPRISLEISLLKVIEAGNIVPLSTILSQFETLLPQLDELEQAETEHIAPEPTKPTPKTALVSGAENKAQEETRSVAKEITTHSPPTAEVKKKSGEEPTAVVTNPPCAASETLTTKELQNLWPEFITFLEKEAIWLAAAVHSAEKQELITTTEQAEVHLYFSDRKESAVLAQAKALEHLTKLALDFFKQKLTIQLHRPGKNRKIDRNSPKTRRQELARDPLVQMTEEVFHGQIAAIRLTTVQEDLTKEGTSHGSQ